MIQITLRPIDGSSPSEERIQRPERPQRANRPPGNTSPLQSFIIRAHTGQNFSGREELPRPNAPVQDENYNNRSISPLFANQSSSNQVTQNYQIIPGPQQQSSSENDCEMPQASRPEHAEPQAASSSNNSEFRIHSPPGFSSVENNNQDTREDHNETSRQRIWFADRTTSNVISGRTEAHVVHIDGNLASTLRRNERPLLPNRLNRRGNLRDDIQERPTMPDMRNGSHSERDWAIRRSRIGGSVGRIYSPPGLGLTGSPSTSRQNWEMWSGAGGVPRRPLRRELRELSSANYPQPPIINLVEGEDEPENTSAASVNASNLPGMSETGTRWVGMLSSTQRAENPQFITSNWRGNLITSENNINVLEDEERLMQEEEEDNEVLMSVPPEYNRDQQPSASDPLTQRQGGDETSVPQPRNSNFMQMVLLTLECPVCFDYVTPPIAQCYQGHLVCNKCRSRLAHCPECRGPFSAVRPRTVEKIASLLEYPCSNEGCSQLVSPANRINHAKSCPFRSFLCPIKPVSCPWTGQKAALRDHILNIHAQELHWINNSRLVFQIQPIVGKEKVFIMETMDHLFLVKFTVAPQDKLRGCVTLLGYDASRVDSMNVMVLVQSADRPSPCLMVSRSPTEENDEMDMRLEKFAVFNISQLVQNSQTQSPITVKVSIGRSDILRLLDCIFD